MKIILNILGEEKEFTLEQALELKRQLGNIHDYPVWSVPSVWLPNYDIPPFQVITVGSTDNAKGMVWYDAGGRPVVMPTTDGQ